MDWRRRNRTRLCIPQSRDTQMVSTRGSMTTNRLLALRPSCCLTCSPRHLTDGIPRPLHDRPELPTPPNPPPSVRSSRAYRAVPWLRPGDSSDTRAVCRGSSSEQGFFRPGVNACEPCLMRTWKLEVRGRLGSNEVAPFRLLSKKHPHGRVVLWNALRGFKRCSRPPSPFMSPRSSKRHFSQHRKCECHSWNPL